MKAIKILLQMGLALSMSLSSAFAQQPREAEKIIVKKSERTLHSQWNGKRVAILGDSMTDKRRIGTTCVYWEYLSELLKIKPLIYGVNGHTWKNIYQQAQKLYTEKKDLIDAILIFAGTNDYNGNTLLGKFFEENTKETNQNGKTVIRKYRKLVFTDSTFCGRINNVLSYLKQNYPTKQIIIMTPIHRAFAEFGEHNVQPDENYCNGCGLYINDYVEVLKKAGSIWSIPVIDLFTDSGLYPLCESNNIYFHDAKKDMLHPNANGDYRIAKTIQYHLLTLPASF